MKIHKERKITGSQLAEQVLSSFKAKTTSSALLFHEERLRTNAFVHLKLVSKARKAGYQVSVTNLKENKEGSAKRLALALRKEGKNLPLIKRISFNLRTVGILRRELDSLDALDMLIGAYRKSSSKMLITLEDIDLIANLPEEESFIYALRGILEREKEWLHVIFTGSDQKALGTLFLHPQSALYKSTSLISLQQAESSTNGASPLIAPC